MSCTVCLNDYTVDGPSVPYNLPCGHSTCKSCLRNMRHLRCPSCRSPFTGSSLKKNFALIELLGREEGASKCSQCNASWPLKRCRICTTCASKTDRHWMEKYNSFFLCGGCVLDSHSGNTHSVKKIAELQNEIDAAYCRRRISQIKENICCLFKETVKLESDEKEIVKAITKEINRAISLFLSANTCDKRVHIEETVDDAQKELEKLNEARRIGNNSLNNLYNRLKDLLPESNSLTNLPNEREAQTIQEIGKENADKLKAFLRATILYANKTPTVEEHVTQVLKCFEAVGRAEFGKPTVRSLFKVFADCASEDVFAPAARASTFISNYGVALFHCLADDSKREEILDGLADFCEWTAPRWEKYWPALTSVLQSVLYCGTIVEASKKYKFSPTVETFRKVIDAAKKVPNYDFTEKIRYPKL